VTGGGPASRALSPTSTSLSRSIPALAALVLVAGACGASSPPPPSDWQLPNLSRASTRAQDDGVITPANVARLRRVWRFRLPASLRVSVVFQERRVLIATPVVAGDSVYLQDTKSGVYALDRRTGKPRWQHPFHATNAGRNGLAFSSGSVYGATDTTAFALSSRTGRLIWQRRLVTDVEQFVDIAPLVAENVVYASTVGYPPGGRGALYALDAHSGKVLWKFVTIRDRWRSSEAGGGGAWYTPSYDGNVYFGVANPYPLGGRPGRPNGGDYPGPALYTDSLLAIDGRSGKLRWYDQVTPHDVRDHDFQLPPILTGDAIVGAGKGGIVIA